MGHQSVTRLVASRFPSHRKRNLTLGSSSRLGGNAIIFHYMKRCAAGIATVGW